MRRKPSPQGERVLEIMRISRTLMNARKQGLIVIAREEIMPLAMRCAAAAKVGRRLYFTRLLMKGIEKSNGK